LLARPSLLMNMLCGALAHLHAKNSLNLTHTTLESGD